MHCLNRATHKSCKAICLKQTEQWEQVQHLPWCPTAHNHFSGQRGHCLSWQVPNGLNYLAILERLFLLIREENVNHPSQRSLAPREPSMLIEENITMCPIWITWVRQARGFYYPHPTTKDGGHQLHNNMHLSLSSSRCFLKPSAWTKRVCVAAMHYTHWTK